jgi:hypothetical protein
MNTDLKENVKRFKAKLSGLKRRRRFIRWGESGAFARELMQFLDEIKAGIEDPKTGAELVISFYEADRGVLGTCDDSSGYVGDVFRYHARDLFVFYASHCEDKGWLADLVARLNQKDDYGVRGSLVNCAGSYLPEPVIRRMADNFWKSAARETDEYGRRHFYLLVESLARQLKDAPLFEKARITAWGGPSTAACIDIARVYLKSGEAKTALSWLERIAAEETFMADERDRLLLEVYGKLGQHEKQAETAWRIFRSSRSVSTLEILLDIIGLGEREQVIAGETSVILLAERLSYSDASFLLSVGKVDDAESYIIARSEQINGDFYGSLLPLAETMEKEGRMLAATVIYRSLLDSILRRAQSKYYNHGVRYLKKLDRLSASVPDWRNLSSHEDYLARLRRDHGRKPAFWGRYEK